MGLFAEGYSWFRSELSNIIDVDSFLLKIVVVLERHVSGVEMVVRGTVGLLEAGVFLVRSLLTLQHPAEVKPREDAVVRHNVVHRVGLEVVEVLEASGVGVSEEERHEGVPVVDGIEILAFHELFNVVFDNRFLVHGSCLGPGSVNINAVAKGKDVLVSLVL